MSIESPPSSSPRRVCLITGANTGIGFIAARELARDGLHVFMACRSETRTRPAIEAIRRETGNPAVEFLPLDLGDLASVRRCAESFLARGLPLHLLINNAGVAGARGLTASGFERAFGINHVGHFLLTDRLCEALVKAAPARIVIVASKAHRRARGIDFEAVRRPTRTLTGIREYAVSKLANILHAAELGRRLEVTGVSTYAVHPGVVATDLWRHVPRPFRSWLVKSRAMLTPEEGARTLLHCARAASVAHDSGLYYDDGQVATPTRFGQDPALAQALYERSQQWVAAGA